MRVFICVWSSLSVNTPEHVPIGEIAPGKFSQVLGMVSDINNERHRLVRNMF